jgi:hypothetical protein
MIKVVPGPISFPEAHLLLILLSTRTTHFQVCPALTAVRAPALWCRCRVGPRCRSSGRFSLAHPCRLHVSPISDHTMRALLPSLACGPSRQARFPSCRSHMFGLDDRHVGPGVRTFLPHGSRQRMQYQAHPWPP